MGFMETYCTWRSVQKIPGNLFSRSVWMLEHVQGNAAHKRLSKLNINGIRTLFCFVIFSQLKTVN